MKLPKLLFPQKEFPEAARKWNLMWDLWVRGEVASPYAELMKYDAEVNNGGHAQYFVNVANCGDLSAVVARLLAVLPNPLRNNLKRAYDSVAQCKDNCHDGVDELLAECDDVFYENEQCLLDLLSRYVDSLSL